MLLTNIGISFPYKEWYAMPFLSDIFLHDFHKILTSFIRRFFKDRYDDISPYNDGESLGVAFKSKIPSSFLTLGEFIDYGVVNIQEVFEEYLKSIKNENDIFASFNFPKEYKHIYAQYLMYFGKFLEDLELPSDTKVEIEGDHVLLKVLPENKEQAIEQIYMALAGYLSLLDDKDANIIRPNDDLDSQIKYQQLIAMVEHLRSQLRLAEATISFKSKEIKLLEKAHSSSSNDQNYWEPLNGFRVGKIKKGPFEIDVPKLINKLKKRK